MSRKLASIQIVKEVANIPGKDRIGYISFENVNWKVIGSKFLQPGDKVVYVEYDSILPIAFVEAMEETTKTALKKRCYSSHYNGCKISCMKMSGHRSYGILFQFNELGINKFDDIERLPADYDITNKFGIFKVEDLIDTSKKTVEIPWWKRIIKVFLWKYFGLKTAKPKWLNFVSRTDETRIHAMPPSIFEELKGTRVYVSTKQDGQSISLAIYKNRFYVASRNLIQYNKSLKKAMKELTPSHMDHFAKYGNNFLVSACKYNAPKMMNEFLHSRNYCGDDFTIQCEQCGPGIQGNKMGLTGLELRLFNFFNNKKGIYYGLEDLYECTDALKIPLVDIQAIKDFDWKTIEEIEEYARGKYPNGNDREGIVVRAMVDKGKSMPPPLYSQSNMLSFKVINPDYVLE